VVEPIVPSRVLVVVAHPDDVDFGAAATVAGLVDDGAAVAYVVVTDGQRGGFDPSVPRERIGPTRREEQRAAARTVGVEDVTFLGFEDGTVVPGPSLHREVVRHVRRWRPDVVIAPSPERDWDRLAGAGHPDHLAVGEAVARALYPDVGNPFALPDLAAEGFAPHEVTQVWFIGAPRGRLGTDHVVDVTDRLERKLAAIACHASQLPDPEGVLARVRDWTAANARAAGLPEGRHAERFNVVAVVPPPEPDPPPAAPLRERAT
jgi:LmbE family N-acetylglucosaminyl deacetylase